MGRILVAVGLLLGWACVWGGEFVVRCPADLRPWPVVLSAGQLISKPGTQILRDSVTVRTGDGRRIPVQIDHRDSNGKYVRPTGPYLCPEDEIAFLTVADSDGRYVIQWGRAAVTAQQPSSIRMELPSSFADLALTNGDSLQICIKASGARPDETKIALQEDGSGISEQTGTNAVPMEHLLAERRKTQNAPSRSARGDYAKGGMEISYKGTKISASGWDNLTLPVQPLGRSWDSPAWSTPVVVASGPVRKIVRICYEEDVRDDVIKNGLYLRKGIRGPTHVEHYFAIYDKTGVVDFLERMEYAGIDLCALLAYSFQMRVGNIPAREQQLLIPDDIEDGKLRCITQEKMLSSADYAEAWRVLFENPMQQKALPGYFGWRNPHSKMTVSVFYDVVENDLETTSLTIHCNTKDLQKSRVEVANATLAKTLFLGEKNAGTPGVFQIRFRFVVDDEREPEEIRGLYEQWKASMPLAGGGVL